MTRRWFSSGAPADARGGAPTRTWTGALALAASSVLVAAACGTGQATPSSAAVGAAGSATGHAVSPVASIAAPASLMPSLSPTASFADDWPVYHLDAGRSGAVPGFSTVTGKLATAWAAPLDGAVYGEPLIVHGMLIAATEGDSVYALDPASGSVLWRQNLGTPVRKATLPCGGIDPLGITGTPAFDAATGSLFAVAEVTGPHHILYALDPDSGAVRWSRNVDLAGEDPTTHQQRPALAVANGYVYTGFGGLAGDCGQYKGKVVGVPTSGQGSTIAYVVPVQREGAVWATGGPAIDAAGNLYVSTGNGSSTSKYDGSDSVVELSPSLQLISRFSPVGWAQDNAGDADLGSMSPMLLPNGFVFIAGKSSQGYVLRQGALGDIGGQVSTAPVCAGFGAGARNGNSVFVPCSDGLREVTISSTGAIAVVWHTATGASGSPVYGGGAVWTLNTGTGTLFALAPDTGVAMGSLAVGPLPHFVSPTLWRGRVFVGTMAGVTAVTAS